MYFILVKYPPASFIKSSPHATLFLFKPLAKRQSILPEASQAKFKAEQPNSRVTDEYSEAKLFTESKKFFSVGLLLSTFSL